MEKNWVTGSSTIKGTFKTLEIPRVLPSCIFLSWSVGNEIGISKCFHSNTRIGTLDDTFIIRSSRKKQERAKLSIQSKSMRGSIICLGQAKMAVPTSVFDGTSTEGVYKIETDVGTFVITIEFMILPEEDLTQPSFYIRDTANLSLYSSKIRKLKPTILTPDKPSDFWGDEGLIKELGNISHCRATEAALDELENLNSPLHKTARDVDFYSDFVQKIIILLMEPPLSINSEGSIVFIKQKYDSSSNSNLVSVVAIRICQTITKFLKGKPEVLYLEMPLIDICGSIAHLICDPNSDFIDLIYIISTSYFIVSYILERHPNVLPTVIDAFKVVIKHACTVYLMKVKEIIQKKCASPQHIKALVVKHEKLFQIMNIPMCVWKELYAYIMKALDYYQTTHWIANSLELEIDFHSFKNEFPGIDFPYIESIKKICKNPELYLRNSNSIKELKITGDWLWQALTKANEHIEKPLQDEKILKLVKNPEQPTLLVDIDYHVQTNKIIDEAKIEIPFHLPILPDEYR
ncbi:hypothetical protein TRFO_10824 [Tritrichomonas foetus]|uniref:Uncharacterized protein n=1 Tax=Tritrichomonas foetus TaxID=1144522 RepID=A0A1J4JBU6_9EUKA|nr:hypothetical protein TRFO_10824 [Tritrichomonas foetus]|eukprot:OHS94885.1 hypothetical protein TRFO_10824 [Tritrichomonas foetus]